MTKPIVVEDVGGYTLAWEAEKVKASITNLRAHASDGRITGDLRIETTNPGIAKLILSPSSLNFKAPRSRIELARKLAGRFPDVDWEKVLEQTCEAVINRITAGEPVTEINTGEDISPPQWLLYPLLLESLSTVVFGDRGSAKSTLALAWAQIIGLPWDDNPLCLNAPDRMYRSLYLDWEVSRGVLAWQAKKLQTGMSKGPFFQNYRRMTRPLAADLDAVRHWVGQTKAEVLIIDSLGPAAGGDLNSTQSALDFFSGLAQLHVTSLILAHTAKNSDNSKRSIYGNGFFENEARNIWEIRALQEPGDDTLEVGLFHRKPLPFYGKLKPFGYKLSFTDTTTSISPQDPESTHGFEESLSIRSRIFHHITDNGPRTVKDIASELQITLNAAQNGTKALKKKNLLRVFNDGKDFKWALPLSLKTDG